MLEITTASLTNSTSINHGTAWSVKSSIQHVQHVEEDGFITFTVDSGADVNVNHGNGNGLDNFDSTSSISLEVADQRLVSTKGMGEIAGKITNIHVAPSFATSLLSVYQMYKEGKAVLFHPTAGTLLANANDMKVTCDNALYIGYVDGSSFKFKVQLNLLQFIQL